MKHFQWSCNYRIKQFQYIETTNTHLLRGVCQSQVWHGSRHGSCNFVEFVCSKQQHCPHGKMPRLSLQDKACAIGQVKLVLGAHTNSTKLQDPCSGASHTHTYLWLAHTSQQVCADRSLKTRAIITTRSIFGIFILAPLGGATHMFSRWMDRWVNYLDY